MIKQEQLVKVGHTIKPHGINGEITIVVDVDCSIENLSCVVFNIDGIYVPFFSENIRTKTKDSYLVKFIGYNSDNEVLELSNAEVFAHKNEINENLGKDDGVYAEDLVGYNIYDQKNVLVGEIIDIEDSTDNSLFIVERQNKSICYIPITNDFIEDIDVKNKYLQMLLPEGLLDL